MASPTSRPDASRPLLFVAREPDETLRTFLPVIDRLQSDHHRTAVVLFHHSPGHWACLELEGRGVGMDEVRLASQILPGRLASVRVATAIEEIGRFWQARGLARQPSTAIGHPRSS